MSAFLNRFVVQAYLLCGLGSGLAFRPNNPESQEGNQLASQTGSGSSKGRYAFVMMAFDPPGTPVRSLWGVLPMAHAVKRLSNYPLIVLTNTTQFPDGSDVTEAFRRLGAQVLPVSPVPVPDQLLKEKRYMPCQEVNPPVCQYQFLKLQIWRLAQFDKLIWMDSDAILTRNVDSLFTLPGTFAQQDNWDCGSTLSFLTRFSLSLTHVTDWLQRHFPSTPSEQQSEGVCSGFVVFKPSEKTYQGMVDYMGTLDTAPGGDQQIIADYFEKVKHQPVKLLNVSTASFGQCTGKIPGDGVPAFVHKSEWVNNCFHLGAEAADCKSEPLGRYWHKEFCSAASVARINVSNVNTFCQKWNF